MLPAGQTSPEIKDLFQRFFRLRHRFRVSMPENITNVKNRLHQTAQGGSLTENGNNFDLFFNIGSLLVHHNGPMAMGDLSRSLNVPLSSATRIVDWLVSNDIAERLPDPDDRRVVLVGLTESGLDLYREIDAFFIERVERLLHGFTPEERSTFGSLLLKIINTMEKEA